MEGAENEADIGTKLLSRDVLDRILKSLNLCSRLEEVSRFCRPQLTGKRSQYT